MAVVAMAAVAAVAAVAAGSCWLLVGKRHGKKNYPLTHIMRLIFRGNFFTFVRVMDFKSRG